MGRPSSSTDDPHIDEINTLVRANRRLTVRELAEECGISVGSCHHILTEELKMNRVAAKFVPRLMTSDQQAHRVQVCQDLLDHSEAGWYRASLNSSDGPVVWSVCLLSCRLGFDSESGQTNDFNIGIHSFPA